MLTYSFSDIGTDSLYEYLYKCIKNDILKGVLAPGGRLPSKRSFARHLNVSTITIENAYAQLLAEGYIYSIPKKGYYAADISAGPTGRYIFCRLYQQSDSSGHLSFFHMGKTPS